MWERFQFDCAYEDGPSFGDLKRASGFSTCKDVRNYFRKKSKGAVKEDDIKESLTEKEWIWVIELLINNSSEFRWVGTVFGKWFLAGEHWFQFLPLDDGIKIRFIHGLFKIMVSVENTRKGFIAMNEALKKEAEAK